MKRVFYLVMFGSMLASVSAQAAVELGVIVDKQFGKAHAIAAGAQNYKAVSPTGAGFRVGYSLLDLKVAEFGLAATYHPKAENDVVISGTNYGKYGVEYYALGAQADWKFLVNLHAGFDIRREKLTSNYTYLTSVNGSTTITRPWIKAGVGFGIPLPVVSPFLRLEAAVATKSESDANDGSDDNAVRKMLAPNYQVGLYGGIRF